MVQAGDWKKGTAGYIAPARNYMLVAMLVGYLSAAALYLASIGAVKRDITKREALARTGGPAQVNFDPTPLVINPKIAWIPSI